MKLSSEQSLIKDLKVLALIPESLKQENFQFRAYYNTIEGVIRIEYLYVPIEFRRYGYATRFVESILTLSDIYKVNTVIEPSEKFGLKIETLEQIYTKWGFVKNDNNQMVYVA